MFRVLLVGFLISANLFADYRIFVNKSEPFSDGNISQKKTIFFGDIKDYRKSLQEIQKNILAHGVEGAAAGLSTQSTNLAKGLLGEGLKAGVSGMGIGLLIGALDPYIMSFYADQQYIKVYKITLKNGNVAYMNKFFVGDKHPSLSADQIKAVLEKKQ